MAITRVFLNYRHWNVRHQRRVVVCSLGGVGSAVRLPDLLDLLDDRSTVPMIAVTRESAPRLATSSGVIQHLVPDLDNCRRGYRTEQDRALSTALPSSRFAPEPQTWPTTVVAAAQWRLAAFKIAIAVAAGDLRYSEVLRLTRRLEAKLDRHSQWPEGQPELRFPELTHGLPWPARRALIASPVGAGKTSSLLRAVHGFARLRIELAVTRLTLNAVSSVKDGWPLPSTAIVNGKGRLSATSIDHRLDGFTGAEPIASWPTPSAEDGACNHSEDALHSQVWLAGDATTRRGGPASAGVRHSHRFGRTPNSQIRPNPSRTDSAATRPTEGIRGRTGVTSSRRCHRVAELEARPRPRSARPQTPARSAHSHGRLAAFRALTVPLSPISR